MLRAMRAANDAMTTTASEPSRNEREDISYTIRQSSLGHILVASTAKGIRAVFLDNDPSVLVRNLEKRFPRALLVAREEEPGDLAERVVALAEDPRLSLDLPLDIQGTDFQKRVWQAIRAIPFGETSTYLDIARSIGAPKASRAVAQACGANHIAVVIPCHRVVRKDGHISGYRWGVERKRVLLEREKRG